MLPSCSALNKTVYSVLKLPLGVVRQTSKAVGIRRLSDAPAQPVTDEQEQLERRSIGIDPVPDDSAAE